MTCLWVPAGRGEVPAGRGEVAARRGEVAARRGEVVAQRGGAKWQPSGAGRGGSPAGRGGVARQARRAEVAYNVDEPPPQRVTRVSWVPPISVAAWPLQPTCDQDLTLPETS